MLKPLTLSLSLAVALGICSVSMAGGYDSNCTTCGLASPQGGPYASGQGGACGWLRITLCPQEALFQLPSAEAATATCRSSTHTCSYEWVLKKKHNWLDLPSSRHAPCGGAPVYATGQAGAAPSGQAIAAGWSGLTPTTTCSSGLRGWSARLPACQAGDLDRVGSGRDDPGDSGR